MRVAPEVIETTTQQKPRNATHWSTRTLARALGTTQSMVLRVWQANGLKPQLVRTFKLSNDPHFVEKVVGVVCLDSQGRGHSRKSPPGKGCAE